MTNFTLDDNGFELNFNGNCAYYGVSKPGQRYLPTIHIAEDDAPGQRLNPHPGSNSFQLRGWEDPRDAAYERQEFVRNLHANLRAYRLRTYQRPTPPLHEFPPYQITEGFERRVVWNTELLSRLFTLANEIFDGPVKILNWNWSSGYPSPTGWDKSEVLTAYELIAEELGLDASKRDAVACQVVTAVCFSRKYSDGQRDRNQQAALAVGFMTQDVIDFVEYKTLEND